MNKWTIWALINVVWWFSSIALGLGYNIDLNPFLGNSGEIILNTIIFGLGVLYLDYKEKKELREEI